MGKMYFCKNLITMKKIIAIAFVGVLALSCSKNSDKSWQDSDTMLQEPNNNVVDSAAMKAPVNQSTESVIGDSPKAESNQSAEKVVAEKDSASTH